jgi:hypothetical protein
MRFHWLAGREGSRAAVGASADLVSTSSSVPSDAAFAALYNQAETDLKAQLYTSGNAAEVLARGSGVLTAQAGDLVDAATVQREAANIAKLFA